MRTWMPTVALAVIFWPLTLLIVVFVLLAANESEEDKINRMNKGG